jgi:hypothetical protein
MQYVLVIYIIGFLAVFVTEYFVLGDRFFSALIKSIFWFIWVFIVWFNKTGKNT